jgi:hypothetical protein
MRPTSFPAFLALPLCLLITSCQKSATEPTEAVASIRFTAPTMIEFKNWTGQVESLPVVGGISPKVEITRTGAVFSLKSEGEVIEIPVSRAASWKPQ